MTILFPNDLYFPLIIQENWTKHWRLSRGQTEVLVCWKTGICQLGSLQFKKAFFPYFIKVSDTLLLFSSNNKTRLRSSRVVVKTNRSFSSHESVLFTNHQEDVKESCNRTAVQFVAQNTQSRNCCRMNCINNDTKLRVSGVTIEMTP